MHFSVPFTVLAVITSAAANPFGGKPYNDSRDEVELAKSSANRVIELMANAEKVLAGGHSHPKGDGWRPHVIDGYRAWFREDKIILPARGDTLCTFCGAHCTLPGYRCCAPNNVWKYAGGVHQCPEDEFCTFGTRHDRAGMVCCKIRERDSMWICPDDAEYPEVEMEYYYRKNKGVRQGYWANHTVAPERPNPWS